ncbi:MAG: BspA family leucine-rich repeat surface protein [Paludibacteraceae bacterium]|nr:BspA family leucine-rich repeat surface protein [Paludibacteraceae bacterium]
MKKLFTLLTALMATAMMSSAFGATYTVTKSINDEDMYKHYADGQQIETIYDNEFSISVNKVGNNGKIYGGDTWRLYEKDEAVVTVKAKNGNFLGLVSFNFTATNNAILTYGGKEVKSGIPVLAGDDKTMIFRVKGNGENGQIRITKFSVSYNDEAAPLRVFGQPSDNGDTLHVRWDFYNAASISDGKIPFPEWRTNAYDTWRDGFKVIQIEPSMKNAARVDFEFFFNDFASVEKIIGMENLNTSEGVHMRSMFSNCAKLESIDLSHLDVSRAKDIYGMFENSIRLQTLDLSNFNTANVTSMSSMFHNCFILRYIMFGDKFTTENATSMYAMFSNCSELQAIDLSQFNTKKVTTMEYMFNGCKKLTTLDLRSIFTTAVTNSSKMFQDCNNLQEILFKGNMAKQDNIVESEDMFKNCPRLTGEMGTTIEGNPLDKSYARPDQGPDSEQPGYFSKNPREIYGKYIGDEQGHVLTLYFDRNRTEYDYTIDEWKASSDVKSGTNMVIFDETMKDARPTSTSGWFSGFEELTEFSHLDYLNTTAVMDMSDMFFGCEKIEELDLRTFDFIGLVKADNMFGLCSALTTIYCATDFRELPYLLAANNMFNGCTSLEGGRGTKVEDGKYYEDFAHVDASDDPGYFTAKPLPVLYAALSEDGKTMTLHYDINIKKNKGNSSWILAEEHGGFSEAQREAVESIVIDEALKDLKPTDMSFWFANFPNAEKIEHLDYINTDNVVSMLSLFAGCTRLVQLDLSSFKTDKVTDMSYMFSGCAELRLIEFGSDFKTDNVTDMRDMFAGCRSLKRLDLDYFNTENVTNHELYVLRLRRTEQAGPQSFRREQCGAYGLYVL